MKKDLVLGIKEMPKSKLQWGILSLQHVFAMFGATVLVPILTGLSISVALFASGVGTLIYIALTKAKVPVYLGSSFAYIGAVIVSTLGAVSRATGLSITEIGQVRELISSGEITYGQAYGSAYFGLMVVGLIYALISVIIKFTGKAWLSRLLPPVVIGPMIAIIGISLASVATGQAGLSPTSGDSFFAFLATNPMNAVIAVVAFSTTVILAVFAKGFFKIVPIVGGIAVGYVFALITGNVDFSGLAGTPIFAIPNFTFLGTYVVDFSAVAMFAPIAFVTIAEHIGDHKVLGSITGEDFLKDPGLDKTLLGDGVATFVSAALGGPANTTYGENTGVVGMTKVASVWVIGGAAVISIILSFFSIFTALVATIPTPVMGGVLILLFGLIAGNGLKVMVDARVNLASMRNLIVVSTMLVIGLGNASIKLNDASSLTGMALAVIVGIILNLVLPQDKSEEPQTLEDLFKDYKGDYLPGSEETYSLDEVIQELTSLEEDQAEKIVVKKVKTTKPENK